jgi:hypothetical protein
VVSVRTLTGRPTLNSSPPAVTMHIPSGLSPRQVSDQNYASSLILRAIKKGRSNADSPSSSEPRGTLQIRETVETGQSTPSGNSTVFIIIVRLSDVSHGIHYFDFEC